MAKDIFWVTVTFSVLIAVLTLAFWPSAKTRTVTVKYDCRVLIGGWHPDVPQSVQDECRNLRSEK
jgi:hypothetical protein